MQDRQIRVSQLLAKNTPTKLWRTTRYDESDSELGEKLKSCCACISDLVLDVYREDSLKAETWEDRANAVRISEKKLTPTYKDFKKLLRHNGIKTESEYFYDSYFHQTIGGYRKFEKQFITFVSPTNNKKQTLEYSVTSVVQLKMV